MYHHADSPNRESRLTVGVRSCLGGDPCSLSTLGLFQMTFGIFSCVIQVLEVSILISFQCTMERAILYSKEYVGPYCLHLYPGQPTMFNLNCPKTYSINVDKIHTIKKNADELYSAGIANGRMQLIYLYLFTDCFMLQSSEQIIDDSVTIFMTYILTLNLHIWKLKVNSLHLFTDLFRHSSE